MLEKSSQRKVRRDSDTSSIEEPDTSSFRTADLPCIPDKGFSENSEKDEKSEERRVRETDNNQREI